MVAENLSLSSEEGQFVPESKPIASMSAGQRVSVLCQDKVSKLGICRKEGHVFYNLKACDLGPIMKEKHKFRSKHRRSRLDGVRRRVLCGCRRRQQRWPGRLVQIWMSVQSCSIQSSTIYSGHVGRPTPPDLDRRLRSRLCDYGIICVSRCSAFLRILLCVS